ncbi:hypothetical protein BKA57DRAFT_535207 [Linnemannia elongata]|nr:hypothetical protein BKA57DRAFT_535207 [Linnemannia elongata]
MIPRKANQFLRRGRGMLRRRVLRLLTRVRSRVLRARLRWRMLMKMRRRRRRRAGLASLLPTLSPPRVSIRYRSFLLPLSFCLVEYISFALLSLLQPIEMNVA